MRSLNPFSETAREIFHEAIKAVDPGSAVKSYIPLIRSKVQRDALEKIFLVSFGKAAYLMAEAASQGLADLISEGIVITKYGHALEVGLHDTIAVYEAGHPVPDDHGLHATRLAIKLLERADKKTLLVCLISGGGSALLVAPYSGISLQDKQAVTDLLLKAGASINELNAVRKHLSAIKGGRLAERAYPASIVSLILSDVIGDDLDVIASGPTSPDFSTYRSAWAVLEKYGLLGQVPGTVTEVLRQGIEGTIPETPKEGDPVFERVENIIVGSNQKAAEAAEEAAKKRGFATQILSTELRGEATDAARWLAKKAMEAQESVGRGEVTKVCLIAGGETTVTVRGSGKGGRNTELALAFALAVRDLGGITLLSAGTDGTDGPTDAAGAIVTGDTISRALSLGLDAGAYLANNDSYTFFAKMGDLLITGPTGTNVMDLQIILIG